MQMTATHTPVFQENTLISSSLTLVALMSVYYQVKTCYSGACTAVNHYLYYWMQGQSVIL